MSGHWYLDDGQTEPLKTPEQLDEEERQRNRAIGETILARQGEPMEALTFLSAISTYRSDPGYVQETMVQMLRDFSPEALSYVRELVICYMHSLDAGLRGDRLFMIGKVEPTNGFTYAVPEENEPADVWLDRTIQLNISSEKDNASGPIQVRDREKGSHG